MVPGLSVIPSFFGAPQLTIRGVTTGPGNPTVGVVVDDVPFGSSTGPGGGFNASDIDPSDLARVEVLRGPQGTLYGADSLGGLVKYVTVDPSTEGVSGRMQAGTDSVYSGTGLGFTFRGSINVPLSDTFAVRASGFTRQEPGYIDNVATGQHGINKTDADGFRLSALWKPSQSFSLKLGAMIQDSNRHGSPEVDVQPGLRDLEQTNLIETGFYDERRQAYSATITAKLGRAELTAVSGYTVNRATTSLDLTAAFTPFVPLFGLTGTPGIADPQHIETSRFTQEFRLAMPIATRIDWLLGAFYNHEYSPSSSDVLAVNPVTGALIESWYHNSYPSAVTDFAAFTDLTVHITDQFDIQFGGRESHYKLTTHTASLAGPWAPNVLGVPSPQITLGSDADSNAFTYLVTPQFRFSPDLMAYARLASGYRVGGSNGINVSSLGGPPAFKPDTTNNYELGVKGDIVDNLFSFDASLYYIDWKDIQTNIYDANIGQGYYTNGSRAKSQGIELSLELRPLTGLTISTWVAWDDAVLTEALPPGPYNAYGAPGDRLPYSSRFSGSVSLKQEFPLPRGVRAFIGGSANYVGEREGQFTIPPPAVPPRQNYPAYVEAGLRAGLKYESWSADMYANNIANRRGVLEGGLDNINPVGFNYIQPRTVGVSFSKVFE